MVPSLSFLRQCSGTLVKVGVAVPLAVAEVLEVLVLVDVADPL
jgi:hypothetical protein